MVKCAIKTCKNNSVKQRKKDGVSYFKVRQHGQKKQMFESLWATSSGTAVSVYNNDCIKLASLQVTPKIKLLSFRVSKNYVYLSLARPGTDLLEFKELCTDYEEYD